MKRHMTHGDSRSILMEGFPMVLREESIWSLPFEYADRAVLSEKQVRPTSVVDFVSMVRTRGELTALLVRPVELSLFCNAVVPYLQRVRVWYNHKALAKQTDKQSDSNDPKTFTTPQEYFNLHYSAKRDFQWSTDERFNCFIPKTIRRNGYGEQSQHEYLIPFPEDDRIVVCNSSLKDRYKAQLS
jgi:hypothetical protein